MGIDMWKLSDRQKTTVCFIAFIIYAIITLVTVFLHEPWRDEIHAWFLAKESIPYLLHEMRYEGHFILWYLVLMPFVKFDFPIITLNIVSWLIFCASVAFFLWKSPFTLTAKLAVVCTNAFLFWYPVVSRCYVLIAPLLFFLAAIYEKRNKHPFIFAFLLLFLANTHAYIEGFVGIMTLVFFVNDIVLPWKQYSLKEKKEHVISLGIILSGVLIAFLQVAPAIFSRDGAARIQFKLRALAWILDGSNIYHFFMPLFALFFILILIYLFNKDKEQFLIFFAALTYIALFAVFLYGNGVANRALLWFFLLIFVLWNTKSDIKQKSLILLVCSLFLIRPDLNIQDWQKDFSPIAPTVNYIEKTYKNKTPVFIQTGIHTSTFARMLSEPFPVYHLKNMDRVEQHTSLYSKNDLHETGGLSKYIVKIENSEKFQFPVLLVSAEKIPETELKNYRYFEHEFPCLYGGNLYLYELNKK